VFFAHNRFSFTVDGRRFVEYVPGFIIRELIITRGLPQRLNSIGVILDRTCGCYDLIGSHLFVTIKVKFIKSMAVKSQPLKSAFILDRYDIFIYG